MACSPGCASTSPSTSMVNDLLDTDAFSDDSGVDVKPQIQKSHERLLKFSQESQDMLTESNRRNKRKSSEPKKRKDVLLMKRFRWDTDDEDNDLDSRVDEDVDDVFERERPSSGDSGCQLGPSTSLDLSTKKIPLASQVSATLDLSSRRKLSLESSNETEKKKKQKQWRKPKTIKSQSEIKKEPLPTFRQSVIKKHEPCSASGSSSQDTTKGHSLPGDNFPIPVVERPQSSSTPDETSPEFTIGLINGQDVNSRTQGRSVGRPRNYKSMSKQRRIEANARERSRVHTISAAFENLRRAVPAYAHNQKLSKLAILRIASAYIVALACLNDQDYSQDQSEPSLTECVEQCTRTIQAEGRSRRRSTKD